MDSMVDSSTREEHSMCQSAAISCFMLVGQSLISNVALLNALNRYVSTYPEAEIKPISTEMMEVAVKEGKLHNKHTNTIYVLNDPQSEFYDALKKRSCLIRGVTCIIQSLSESSDSGSLNDRIIWNIRRPIFSLAMKNVSIYFTGFPNTPENTDLVARLTNMVHWMGGKIRATFKPNPEYVTHLVSNSVRNKLYATCNGLAMNVMTSGWIEECWKLCHNLEFVATSSEIMDKFKLKPLQGLVIHFKEFPEPEMKMVTSMAATNGAVISDEISNANLTHVVVWSGYLQTLSEGISVDFLSSTSHGVYCVSCQWFYGCIHLQTYIDEKTFLLFDQDISEFDTSLPNENSLKIPFNKISDLSPIIKVCSPLKIVECLSKTSVAVSNSQIMNTSSEESEQQSSTTENYSSNPGKRFYNFRELVNSESNYVRYMSLILDTIRPNLINCSEDKRGPIMDRETVNFIFDPLEIIYQFHQKFLKSLTQLIDPWSNDCHIGETCIPYISGFASIYCKYCNNYEKVVETVRSHDKKNQRFHAFLQVVSNIPECDRLSFFDLLAKPFQRPFQISLLVKELCHNTSCDNPDYKRLLELYDGIEQELKNMNESKKKWETHVEYLEIMQNIEYCPVYLLSFDREILAQFDVNDVTRSQKSSKIFTFYIFKDCVEIAKRRAKHGFGSLASPAYHRLSSMSNLDSFSCSENISSNLPFKSQSFTHKHYQLILVNDIELILDIEDGYEVENRVYKNTFGIGFRISSQSLQSEYLPNSYDTMSVDGGYYDVENRNNQICNDSNIRENEMQNSKFEPFTGGFHTNCSNPVDPFDTVSMCSSTSYAIDKMLFRLIINCQNVVEVNSRMPVFNNINFTPHSVPSSKLLAIKAAIIDLLSSLVRENKKLDESSRLVYRISSISFAKNRERRLSRSSSFLGKAIEKAKVKTRRMSKVLSSTTLGKLTGLTRTNSMCSSNSSERLFLHKLGSEASNVSHISQNDHSISSCSSISQLSGLPKPVLSTESSSSRVPLLKTLSHTPIPQDIADSDKNNFSTPKSTSISRKLSKSIFKRISKKS